MSIEIRKLGSEGEEVDVFDDLFSKSVFRFFSRSHADFSMNESTIS